TIEGGAGKDTMLFNGAAADETFDVSANGDRVRFFRNVANIVMDLNDVEAIDLNTLRGADTVTLNDVTGTDLTSINLNLAATIGGTDGDTKADSVIVNGSNAADNIQVTNSAGGITITGAQPALVTIKAVEAIDGLGIRGNGGDDNIDASALSTPVQFFIDG